MRINLAVILITFLCNVSCNAQNERKEINADIVAKYFLIEDVYINSYIVADKDLDELYEDHKDWVKLYFPEILSKYDLTLYSQFSIASLLYLEGDKVYLERLWEKHKRISNNEEFKYIIKLLELYKIDLK